MIPKVIIPVNKRIAILSFIKFGKLSDSEISLISSLLAISEGLSLTMESTSIKDIEAYTGLNTAAISTYLHRLGKKGVIKKSGKNIQFHPIFKAIHSESLLISFE